MCMPLVYSRQEARECTEAQVVVIASQLRLAPELASEFYKQKEANYDTSN